MTPANLLLFPISFFGYLRTLEMAPRSMGMPLETSIAPSPRAGFSATNTIYQSLQQWMEGDFIGDFDPNVHEPASLNEVAPGDQPAMLDKAALHFWMGGPFHLGCEMT